MTLSSLDQRRRLQTQPRPQLHALQLAKLNRLLAETLPRNAFYTEKLGALRGPLQSLADLHAVPYTFKEELISAPAPGELAANLTFSLEHYVRYHHTSGTRGRPLPVLDTAEDWRWWLEGWQFVLDVAEVHPGDRCLLAFSFGPFIGFWSAHDAAIARGAMVVPSGGMSTLARLELLRTSRASVLFCTPSYALHLAEVGAEHQIPVESLHVRCVIVAGEPGGSIPAVRNQIASAWNARVVDHAGASEVGPWGFGDAEGRGVFVNESEFIAEFISVATGSPAVDGELAELVLTSLGRFGSPVIRYRTGDLVRPRFEAEGSNFVLLEGGVLGRTDDMLIVRGVNIFPSSIEQILRSFPEVIEFRVTATRHGAMDALAIEVEDRLEHPARIAKELHVRLGLKVDVQLAPLGSLPRYEGKGRRFVDRRQQHGPAPGPIRLGV